MENRGSIDASTLPTPSAMMQRFLWSVERNDVRRELAEDCILCLFGRSARGAVPATGYMRRQLLNRFKHVGFQQARHCEPPQVTLIKERFGRHFDSLRREMCEENEKNKATTLHLHAESDDENAIPEILDSVNLDELQYIEANGLLEVIHGDDGGIELGDKRHIVLTVAFRRSESGPGPEICLIIYENYKEIPQKSTLSAPRSRIALHDCIDDENDDASSEASTAPRLKLFGFGSSVEDSAEDSNQSAAEPSARPPVVLDTATTASAEAEPAMEPLTPRKHHQDNAGPDDESKHPTGL